MEIARYSSWQGSSPTRSTTTRSKVILTQQVFDYLVASLSRDVLKQVSSCVTAADLWQTLAELFASQTRARMVNNRIALATTKKGETSIAEYVGKMRALLLGTRWRRLASPLMTMNSFPTSAPVSASSLTLCSIPSLLG